MLNAPPAMCSVSNRARRAWAGRHDVPFEATIERARAILVGHIARNGAFPIACLGGILVCRR